MRGFSSNKKYLIMTYFSLWDELGGMYYAPINVNPEGGGGGDVGKGWGFGQTFCQFSEGEEGHNTN